MWSFEVPTEDFGQLRQALKRELLWPGQTSEAEYDGKLKGEGGGGSVCTDVGVSCRVEAV